MKTQSLRDLIESIWKARCRISLVDEFLLNRLLTDGGHDTEDLTADLIGDLLDGKSPADWNIACFSFSEISSYYLAAAHKMSAEQVVAAVFTVCVLADLARAGRSDWSLEHDKVMALCAILAGRLELAGFLHFMSYVFGKGGEPPIHE